MTNPRINLPVSKLEDEIERLREEVEALLDVLALMSEKYMTEEIQHGKTKKRNDRLALLVRLMACDMVELHPEWVDKVGAPAQGIWIQGELPTDCTYTNGIPDLTDEQWERLAKLERGEA